MVMSDALTMVLLIIKRCSDCSSLLPLFVAGEIFPCLIAFVVLIPLMNKPIYLLLKTPVVTIIATIATAANL
ncbi:hypothetical protein SDC9_81642 [bioreactor metagenome]|uniref:Uncharacterized protein n=1 Tax=bioreactor metagenome TaxID=1076179 RepID=A0A644Z2P8_9ZZZZ